MTPLAYLKIGAGVALLAALGLFYWHYRHLETEAAKVPGLNAAISGLQHAAQEQQAREKISYDKGVAFGKTQARIVVVNKEIIREVPRYITPAIDKRYPIPVGLERVYDASIYGVPVSAIPDPTGKPDDSPSRFSASQFGAVAAENNGSCLVIREQLTALQGWVNEQRALRPAP